MADFGELPDEIVAQILQMVARDSSYCCTTLLQLGAVCTTWRRLAFANRVARELWLPSDAPSISLLYVARACASADPVGPHTLIIDSRTFTDPAMQGVPWEVRDVFRWEGWREAMEEVRRSAQPRSLEGQEASSPPSSSSRAHLSSLEMPLELLEQVLRLVGPRLRSLSFRFCSSAGSSLINERAMWLIGRHCDGRQLARLAMLSSFDGAVCDAHAYLLTAKLENVSTFWCDGGSACFTDRALWHIGYGWQSLRSLCVAGEGVTVEGLLALRRCRALERLKLERCRPHLFDPPTLFLLLKKMDEEACRSERPVDEGRTGDTGSKGGRARSSSSYQSQRGSPDTLAQNKELVTDDSSTAGGVLFPLLKTISFDGTACTLTELSVVALVCPRLTRVVVRVMNGDDTSTPDHMELFKLQSSPLFSSRKIRVRAV